MSHKHKTASNPNFRRKPNAEWVDPANFDPATDLESDLEDVAVKHAAASTVLADAASSREDKDVAAKVARDGL